LGSVMVKDLEDPSHDKATQSPGGPLHWWWHGIMAWYCTIPGLMYKSHFYLCSHVQYKYSSTARNQAELAPQSFALLKVWLLTPEWDGTLPSLPKNRTNRLSWKGCHIALDQDSPHEEQVFGKAFDQSINVWLKNRGLRKTLSRRRGEEG